MSFKTLETKKVKLIPSQILREFMKKSEFCFAQMDLLKFIEEYAPTYEIKLSLLDEAVNEVSGNENVHSKNFR